MTTKGRNVPFFTYGPEVMPLPQLPAANPIHLLETYTEVDVSRVEFRELLASESVLAYLMLPPVTFVTANIIRLGGNAELLREQMEADLYPAKVRLCEYKHIPRIFDLINRHTLPGWDSPLIENIGGRSAGRNVFACAELALELIPAEGGPKEWELRPRPWDKYALKTNDRVFVIKEEYIAP